MVGLVFLLICLFIVCVFFSIVGGRVVRVRKSKFAGIVIFFLWLSWERVVLFDFNGRIVIWRFILLIEVCYMVLFFWVILLFLEFGVIGCF